MDVDAQQAFDFIDMPEGRIPLAAAGCTEAGKMKYLYSHDYEGGYVPQAYLPEGLPPPGRERAGEEAQGEDGLLA